MKIGKIVPYKNTRGNISYAKIKSFEIVDNRNVWFHGFDEKTSANVFYPVHESIQLIIEEFCDELYFLTNPMFETGREGCTYGDTEFNSIDVCFGYNTAKEEVQDIAKKKILKFKTSHL